MLTILVLLVLFQLKHFVADFPLQNPYMLGKFKETGWVAPLAAHAGVHAFFTFAIALFFLRYQYALIVPVCLALFDFAIHFTMDRVKASPKLLGRFKALSPGEYAADAKMASSERWCPWAPSAIYAAQWRLRRNTYFWWALGFDQMAHHLTHYAIIAFLVTQ